MMPRLSGDFIRPSTRIKSWRNRIAKSMSLKAFARELATEGNRFHAYVFGPGPLELARREREVARRWLSSKGLRP